jgi:hypothetical protein
MTQVRSKLVWGFVFAALVLLASGTLYAAPKQGLQPLFAASKHSSVPGETGTNGNLVFQVAVQHENRNAQVVVEEILDQGQPTGYAWVWAKVMTFNSDPPARLHARMTELNDASRWGYLSGARLDDGSYQIYLNYFFLVRTADVQALEEYIDMAVVEQQRLAGELLQ